MALAWPFVKPVQQAPSELEGLQTTTGWALSVFFPCGKTSSRSRESSQQWGPAIGSINGAQERTVNGNHLDCIFSDRSTSALSGSRSDSDNLMKHEWKAGRRNVDFCNWVKSANKLPTKLPTKLPSTTISYHQSPTSRLEEIYRLSIWAWLFPQGARKAELFSTWWGSQAHWRHFNSISVHHFHTYTSTHADLTSLSKLQHETSRTIRAGFAFASAEDAGGSVFSP